MIILRRPSFALLLALVLLGGSLPAHAALTVGELRQLCSSRADADIADCDAYLHGVFDGLESGYGWGAGGALRYLESQRSPRPDDAQAQKNVKQSLQGMNGEGRLAAFCSPDAASIDEVVDQILDNLKGVDPRLPAAEGVLHALRAAYGYPCVAETAPTP